MKKILNDDTNLRLSERRTGFIRPPIDIKRVRPSISTTCHTNNTLSTCKKKKKILCTDCLTKNMCEICHQNSRTLRNFFCCFSKPLYS